MIHTNYLYTVYPCISCSKYALFDGHSSHYPSTGLGNIQRDLADITCSRMHCHDSIQSIQSIRRCFWYAFGQDLGTIWPAAAEVLWRPKLHVGVRILGSGMSQKLIWSPKVWPRLGPPNPHPAGWGIRQFLSCFEFLWARFEFQPLMHVQFCQVRSTILGNRKRDAGWVQCPDLPRCWHSWHPNGCKPSQQDERGRNPRPAQTHVLSKMI